MPKRSASTDVKPTDAKRASKIGKRASSATTTTTTTRSLGAPKPWPVAAIEIDAPLNLVSLMPCGIRVVDETETRFFYIPSSASLRMVGDEEPKKTLEKISGAQFLITGPVPPPPCSGNSEASAVIRASLKDKDLLVPLGTEDMIPKYEYGLCHHGRLFTVPPGGPMAYVNEQGQVVGCKGLMDRSQVLKDVVRAAYAES